MHEVKTAALPKAKSSRVQNVEPVPDASQD